MVRRHKPTARGAAMVCFSFETESADNPARGFGLVFFAAFLVVIAIETKGLAELRLSCLLRQPIAERQGKKTSVPTNEIAVTT